MRPTLYCSRCSSDACLHSLSCSPPHPQWSLRQLTSFPTVSWNWGSGAPGGTVAEKKKEGEVSVKSKKGNVIKKKASPDNPAVAIERSGNNVVKKASELNIEKKAGGGGQKRKSENKQEADGEDEDDDLTKNEEGKEVRASGKKQKTGKENGVDGEMKSKGRPKGSGGAKKEKKQSKPRSAEGVGSRTRSRA
jgi:Hypervirulence associated proteins TUDOR domain